MIAFSHKEGHGVHTVLRIDSLTVVFAVGEPDSWVLIYLTFRQLQSSLRLEIDGKNTFQILMGSLLHCVSTAVTSHISNSTRPYLIVSSPPPVSSSILPLLMAPSRLSHPSQELDHQLTVHLSCQHPLTTNHQDSGRPSSRGHHSSSPLPPSCSYVHAHP